MADTIQQFDISSVATMMGENGPEGVLLGRADGMGWLVLRGVPVVAALATPGPALKRARPARTSTGPDTAAVKEDPQECWQCRRCNHKPFTRRGSALNHLRTKHKISAKNAYLDLKSC